MALSLAWEPFMALSLACVEAIRGFFTVIRPHTFFLTVKYRYLHIHPTIFNTILFIAIYR